MLDVNSVKEFLGIKDIHITKLDSFEDNGVYSKVISANFIAKQCNVSLILVLTTNGF